jgi:acyl transferase domain-containing protein
MAEKPFEGAELRRNVNFEKVNPKIPFDESNIEFRAENTP